MDSALKIETARLFCFPYVSNWDEAKDGTKKNARIANTNVMPLPLKH